MGIAKKTKAKSEVTRRALLNAAVKIIGSKGYAGATVDDIALEAGVSKGVMYYYFKTKADIATQVLMHILHELISSFEQDVADADAPYDAMEAIIRDFASRIFQNREAARFVLNELWRQDRLWSEEMRVEEQRLADVIHGLLERAIADGKVRSDLDLEFTSAALTGTVLLTAQYYLIKDENPDVDVFSDLCIDHILHALH